MDIDTMPIHVVMVLYAWLDRKVTLTKEEVEALDALHARGKKLAKEFK